MLMPCIRRQGRGRLQDGHLLHSAAGGAWSSQCRHVRRRSLSVSSSSSAGPPSIVSHQTGTCSHAPPTCF